MFFKDLGEGDSWPLSLAQSSVLPLSVQLGYLVPSCAAFVIIFIASGFAILIINLPFNPRMNSTTTICSFTKGHFPLLPTESWLLPWFDDFRYTEDNSGSLPAGGMVPLVLSGYEQPLIVFPLMGDERVLKKNIGRQP